MISNSQQSIQSQVNKNIITPHAASHQPINNGRTFNQVDQHNLFNNIISSQIPPEQTPYNNMNYFDNNTHQQHNHSQPQYTSRNNILGMIMITFSTFLLMTADAIYKYTTNCKNVSLLQCLLICDLIQNIIAWILWNLPSTFTKKSTNIKLWYGEKEYRYSIWFRGFFYFCDSYFYWKGISLIPLGDAEAIYFLCPIFVSFGARLFLKETFSKTFPFILILTVIGLTILCQPKWLLSIINPNDSTDSDYYESDSINIWGIIALIIGCISWSLMSIMVRKAQNAHWIQIEIVSSLQGFAIFTPLLIFINYLFQLSDIDINLDHGIWKWSYNGMIMILLIGIMSVGGFMFVVLGYQYGEATKVSWMEYTNLPIGYLYQWLLFNQIPNVYETIGASIVMCTCVLTITEEYYNYKIELNQQDTDNIQN